MPLAAPAVQLLQVLAVLLQCRAALLHLEPRALLGAQLPAHVLASGLWARAMPRLASCTLHVRSAGGARVRVRCRGSCPLAPLPFCSSTVVEAFFCC